MLLKMKKMIKKEEKKVKKIQLKLKAASKQNKNCRTQIEKLKTKVERYKKRIQRVQLQASKSISNLHKELDKIKARNELLESALKTRRTLKPKKPKMFETPEITAFYLKDDVSRITSGKKECRFKNKNKKQIRYLVDTIQSLHTKYKAEGGRYGLTTFYKKKPFFVLSPHINARSTCLCEKHENIKFKYETLRRHHIVNDSFDKILQDLVCDIKSYACMYNTCQKCKENKPKFVTDQSLLEKTINWYQWERQDHVYTKQGGTTIHTKKTVRATRTDTEIISFKKHHFNYIHQNTQYQQAVTNLKATEAVVVCDFSENYQCKLASEIQSMHFGASKSQISLHTGMIYWQTQSQSFCTISDVLIHQPPAIWAHLSPILATIKEKCPNVDVIHFYSDGPSSQYRQKHFFFYIPFLQRN